MLCLTRKPGESIRIGDGFSIKVLSIRGRQVRLGIDAPRDVPVDRDEVRERIEREIAARELPPAIPGEWKITEE